MFSFKTEGTRQRFSQQAKSKRVHNHYISLGEMLKVLLPAETKESYSQQKNISKYKSYWLR